MNQKAHLDIKPENLVLHNKSTLKICDFDTMKQAVNGENEISLETQDGTPAYWSPERFIEQPYTGLPQDVFAFAIVLIELYCGERLFDFARLDDDRYKLLCEGKIEQLFDMMTEHVRNTHQDADFEFEDSFIDLICQCLKFDPKARPTYLQLWEHEWM